MTYRWLIQNLTWRILNPLQLDSARRPVAFPGWGATAGFFVAALFAVRGGNPPMVLSFCGVALASASWVLSLRLPHPLNIRVGLALNVLAGGLTLAAVAVAPTIGSRIGTALAFAAVVAQSVDQRQRLRPRS